MSELSFLEILNELPNNFLSSFYEAVGVEIGEQLSRVIVPVQKLGGVAENFSMMSFPYPRLSWQELKAVELIDERSYIFSVSGIEFKVDADQFGQINWFNIKGAPDIYKFLTMRLAQVANNDAYKNHWEF